MKSLSKLVYRHNSGRKLGKDERGQGMAEYIIIVILVAIIVLVAIKLFGKSIFNQFSNATEDINTLEDDAPAP